MHSLLFQYIQPECCVIFQQSPSPYTPALVLIWRHAYVCFSHGGNMRWKRDRPTCCNNISKCCKLSACPIALLFSHLVRFIGNKNRNNNLFIRYERPKREEKKCTHQKKRHTHSSGHSYYTENRT